MQIRSTSASHAACDARDRLAYTPRSRASRRARGSSSSSIARASPTSGSAPCLSASNSATLIVDEADVRVLERGLRRGGEVAQPRADADHEVGLAREEVRRRRPGDADRAERLRMRIGQRALAGLRFADGDAGRVDEAAQRVGRLAVDARRRRRRSAAAGWRESAAPPPAADRDRRAAARSSRRAARTAPPG